MKPLAILVALRKAVLKENKKDGDLMETSSLELTVGCSLRISEADVTTEACCGSRCSSAVSLPPHKFVHV